jgi:hypothetical protein
LLLSLNLGIGFGLGCGERYEGASQFADIRIGAANRAHRDAPFSTRLS